MSTSAAKISKRVEKELHQNKVIIRRLPPDITEERFREIINPLPDHTYFYLAPGDHTLGPLGCSRAYIAFENEDEIVPFRDQYDGMILESEKGGKYRAIVEFAPYQGIPKNSKKKADYRIGTIDKDSDFQSFMQSLENRPEPLPSVNLETYLEELEANRIPDVQVTPLIEYLRERRSGRNRGRVDIKKKRKGGESSSGKGKRSSKSADSLESSSTKGSKSRESSSSKGKKERKEPDSISKTGSSTKLVAKEEGGAETSGSGGSSHRSGSGAAETHRQEKYRGGSERREGGHDGGDTGGEKESRRGKQRNRDRPDRSIYVPRSRDQAGGGGGGGEREGKEQRESSRDNPSRGGRGRQGYRDDSSDYGRGGRSRSGGRGRRYRRGPDQQHESSYKDK